MKILIVDDEKNLRLSLVKLLSQQGWEADAAENGLSAQRMLEETAFDLILLDLRMPGMDGKALLDWIIDQGLGCSVVMMSAHSEVQDAVAALKRGAVDYLSKPFDPDELLLRLKTALDLQNLRQQKTANEIQSVDETWDFPSPAFARIRTIANKAAPTSSLILITGESGTGKEVLAKSIHRLSPWKDGPFVAVNIGGVPENLLESELFGYEKGAFTGADRRKPGLFETAQGGTLFLDEIGEMPVLLQVKLLRVLQERKIQRLGGIAPIPVGARILCATNRDLQAEVRAGRFREDLFYRLNVVPVQLPPLRERLEDLPILCNRLLKKIALQLGRNPPALMPETLALFRTYRFPGNIRELENLLERACIFAAEDVLSPSDFDLDTQERQAPPALLHEGSLATMERRVIQEALLRWEGNQTKASEELGISRRTLFNKIHEYGLTPSN